MRQLSFASVGFDRFGKTTRRAAFLSKMDAVVPWQRLYGLIAPGYPKPGKGRCPVGLDRILRIYFLQHWFGLSDPAAKEALYDSEVMRRFVGIDLGREPVPDETTILNFRHLLERHELCGETLREVNEYLATRALRISTGTIVDATIVHAPSSTKNEAKTRDPKMHQTRKGNQWFFGMKAHIGVDSKTRLIHAVAATAANAHDSTVLEDPLHGDKTRVWGDQAYRGQREVIRRCAPRAGDVTNRRCKVKGVVDEAEKAKNQRKSKVSARAERCFGVMKRVLGSTKVRYLGINRNADWLFACCTLVNLFLVRPKLLHG